jgi:very-short-patch-repair endonuclease/tetrahydromethanopterin S-methyltransferase subunit F
MALPAHEVSAILRRLGSQRRGIVSREELLKAGLTAHQIATRIRAGALTPIFPGVYSVAPLEALPPLARESAALVACRPRALLGRGSAAILWELPVEAPKEIEVLVVGRQRRSFSGVSVRSIEGLAPGELRRVAGLPCASPALALLDLAATLSADRLTAAVHEARVRANLTDHQLLQTLRAHPNRRGARLLGALLRSEGAAKATRSEAERLALRLMHRHGLDPESDVRVGRYRVDFLFRAERLVVEVDGYRFHGTRERFEADRRRTAAITELGFVVFPLTWWDLTERAVESLERLTAALEQRRSQLRLGV